MKKLLVLISSFLMIASVLFATPVDAAETQNNGREYVVISLTWDTRPPLTYWYERGDKRGRLNRSYYEYSNVTGKWYSTYTGYVFYNAPLLNNLKLKEESLEVSLE